MRLPATPIAHARQGTVRSLRSALLRQSRQKPGSGPGAGSGVKNPRPLPSALSSGEGGQFNAYLFTVRPMDAVTSMQG